MKTYYLDDKEVDAYLIDLFSHRLDQARKESGGRELVIAYIGNSGKALINRALQLTEVQLNQARIICANIDRSDNKPSFFTFDPEGGNKLLTDDDSIMEEVRDTHVLLLDSSVHSGGSMRVIYDRISDAGAAVITTYGLVVKASTSFIPNFFSLMIGHDDRALFLLREIPNNRIMSTGCLRLLEMQDMNKQPVKSGLASMDRVSWSDMLYESRVHSEQRRTFVYEAGGKLLAYLSLQFIGQGVLFLDKIAVDESMKNRGLGKSLIRWAETFARHNGCHTISLWAIKDMVTWYEDRDFKKDLEESEPLCLAEGEGKEEYFKMQKTIVFNRLGVLGD